MNKNGCAGCFVACLVLVATVVGLALALPKVVRFMTPPEQAAKEDAERARNDREAAARRELLARDPKAGHEGEICIYVQRQVEQRLKAPGSADFPSCIWHQSQVQYLGDGHYSFNSWVDAQNSFGAKLRTTYDGEALIDDQGLKEHRFEITRLDTH